jgi:hypothetical protein
VLAANITHCLYIRSITVLNVHVLTEDKIDDVNDSFCEELERVLEKFHKYHMKNFLGDYNAKVVKTFSNQQSGMTVYTNVVMIMELG